MLAESLVALHVDKDERARVMAIQHMVIMLAMAPFGWIGGLPSSVSRTRPFVYRFRIRGGGCVKNNGDTIDMIRHGYRTPY